MALGIADTALYAFLRRAGGRLAFQAPLPDGLDPDAAAAFRDAFDRLHRYRQWLTRLPPLAAKAVEVVQAVIRSAIWARAQAASRRFVEAPFQLLRPPGTASPGDVPTLLRGVIDLAFREADGWVIVDYKTDPVHKGEVAELAAHYRPQVKTYAETWQGLMKEPVKETGLYFTSVDRYEVV
jgi:ATP-dependent exoDNAse (exonuclease V) beta subunit